MLRIIHTADVHLGARHDDLGEQAAAQRERQFAAFKAADRPRPRREGGPLPRSPATCSTRTSSRAGPSSASRPSSSASPRRGSGRVIIPGTHDVYDRASIYRAYDLPAMAGCGPDDDIVTVLDPDHPSVHLGALDVVVHGRVFATKRAPHSPLQDHREPPCAADPAATWRIGMVHGSIAIPGKTDRDEVVVTTDEIAASGLDYLALGHWHSDPDRQGRERSRTPTPALRRPVALDQDRAGKVLARRARRARDGNRIVTIDERQVGPDPVREVGDRRRDGRQPAGPRRRSSPRAPTRTSSSTSGWSASAATSSTSTSTRSRPSLAASFLKVRVRDASVPALTEGPLPSADTIAGAFIRDLEARIAELEGVRRRRPRPPRHRDALRLGRLLLAGHEVSL